MIKNMSILLFIVLSLFAGAEGYYNATDEIPVFEYEDPLWNKLPDVAEYGGASWENVVGIAHSVTLEEAKKIAQDSPEITYFFYMKEGNMVLGQPPLVRIFVRGDAVFFTGEPWWGSAEGFADGYIKKEG
ncbi:MAG: hypothetical protein KDK65_07275 [Chlamydiia bacterium]|nr:hypothetical protein [Chlamydiia bacterium]